MKVALFISCLVDGFVPEVAQATVRLLRRLGVEVEVPLEQSCCGQMHINTGYPRDALPLIGNHVRAFAGYDYVVSPSASCTAAVRSQQAEVAAANRQPGLADDARALAARSYDLTEFLTDVVGVDDVGAWFPHRVTYHPTCHSLRLLRVGDRPQRLLRNVEGIDLVELDDASSCCGFGGTFALKNAAVSAAMLEDKTAAIGRTGAEFCTAGDASCLLHIGGGLTRQGSTATTVHLAQILAATREDPL